FSKRKACVPFFISLYFCINKFDMETVINTPVTLTSSAVNEIKRLMSEPTFDADKLLRIGVKGGGCSGMTYVLDFETKTDKDESFDIEGIHCIIDRSHNLYLAGMEVDWQGGLNSRGFTFKNPNASSTCGCGTSFAV
ncbi:MAG TPA: iron-sulfur cluster assembly accessory protein, partial [Ferruginibacter sp.]|nr:iron-sulfur cluster assembly accessory protein [Ferruginibacter sp.]